MLNIDVLENKPVKIINGRQQTDFTVSSINPTASIQLSKVWMVPKGFEMRPDLFSMVYSGDISNLGMILKVNSISNPFSLVTGDILLLPSITSMKNMKSTTEIDNTDEKKRIDFRKKMQDRISGVSPERQNYLESRSIANASNIPLPPNVAGPDDQQFVVKGGKLILGSSIGNCRTNVTQNKSKATIKARLTQQKIFG
jgi:hypothetical protein